MKKSLDSYFVSKNSMYAETLFHIEVKSHSRHVNCKLQFDEYGKKENTDLALEYIDLLIKELSEVKHKIRER